MCSRNLVGSDKLVRRYVVTFREVLLVKEPLILVRHMVL